jgi:hypothetical protein
MRWLIVLAGLAATPAQAEVVRAECHAPESIRVLATLPRAEALAFARDYLNRPHPTCRSLEVNVAKH